MIFSRYSRRFPPVLRALRALGILALLAFVVIRVWGSLPPGADQFGASQGWNRAPAISWSFFLLGMACYAMLIPYRTRFERPGRAEPWPTTWQAQLTAVLALAALQLLSLLFTL